MTRVEPDHPAGFSLSLSLSRSLLLHNTAQLAFEASDAFQVGAAPIVLKYLRCNEPLFRQPPQKHDHKSRHPHLQEHEK